ncbi:sensor domain-containing diguanylate cyclase [Geoalkalibacter sp.]|uniref:sensor domain-containing diguanylate cyclase n=1 Tax=Geoalkalibacter sp. TaxID=3041440 RepID=UPI00272EE66F|nr:GGDEF domain-containing protein [Geoalkalibacter sp.]
MSKEKILAQVLQSGSLPTLSAVASRLIALTSREDTTISEIAALIAHDVSLSAKVLKVVNSSFYSFPHEVGTIQQAVTILGINAVRSLVLSFSFLGMEHIKKNSDFDYRRFWQESLATAVASRMIFNQLTSRIDPEEVFTAGLLHHIGMLVLAQAYPDQYSLVLKQAQDSPRELDELEELHLGVSHAYIGGMITKHWNFPDNLCLPIMHHHGPEVYEGRDPERRQVIQTVYLAGLVSQILHARQPVVFADRFRREAAGTLGLDSQTIDRILETLSDEVSKAAGLFGLDIEDAPSIPEILHRANIELSLINMSYEQMNRELVAAKLALEKLNAELQEKNLYLESIANLDGLTGVFNHRYFQEACERELNRALRGGNPLSLLLADLDHFKRINDLHGHLAGDTVLKEVCRLWRETLRGYDILARYGGEEFAVLLPQTGQDQALVVAEKMRAAVREHLFQNAAKPLHLTCSFGLTTLENVADRNLKKIKDVLFQQADDALYAAKRKGRDRVEIYAAKEAKWYQRLKLPGIS